MEKTREITEAIQNASKLPKKRKRAKTPTAEQWESLTDEQITYLLSRPGLFGGEALRDIRERQRRKRGEQWEETVQAEQRKKEERRTKRREEKEPAKQPSSVIPPLNITLQMNDQEVGRMYAIIKDRDQEEQQRSFGAR